MVLYVLVRISLARMASGRSFAIPFCSREYCNQYKHDMVARTLYVLIRAGFGPLAFSDARIRHYIVYLPMADQLNAHQGMAGSCK